MRAGRGRVVVIAEEGRAVGETERDAAFEGDAFANGDHVALLSVGRYERTSWKTMV